MSKQTDRATRAGDTDCECGARNGEGTPDAPDLTWTIGWFWWTCFPGCLPDSEPNGPFDTEDLALADAREVVDDGEDDAKEGD